MFLPPEVLCMESKYELNKLTANYLDARTI